MSRSSDLAEITYLAALDLEASGRIDDALAAHQSIIDDHGSSLWSDAAARAMDRITAGVPLSMSLEEARAPFQKRFTRPLSFPHALITALIVITQSAVAGPFVAGIWLLVVAMDLEPLIFVYIAGGIPAALSGLLFAVWVLHYCHRRGFMPERVKLVGMLTGVMSVAIFCWVLLPLYIDGFLPVGAVGFLVAHGLVGGAFTGWLGGKLVWYRMDRRAPPYPG